MRFGLSGCGGGFESAGPTELATIARLAEGWGFTSLWLNEEHFQDRALGTRPPRLCLSPLILAAYLAARTSRLRIGFSVLLLPLHQPLRLAEEIASLDVLSGGRVDFGISRGGNARYVEAFGGSLDDQTDAFRSALALVLRCWGDGTVQLGDAQYSVQPKPVQRPHPPVYVGAYTDASVSWAAQQGHRLILHGIQSPASLRRCLATFEGEGGQRGTVPVGRFVYVAEDDATAHRDAWPVVCQLAELLGKIGIPRRPGPVLTEDDLDPERFYREMAIVGSPETCVARIAALRDELGVEHVNLLASLFGFLPAHMLLSSLALFASAVMPRLATELPAVCRRECIR